MGIRVAITDDHNLVVNGVQNILKEDPEIEVYGIYNSGAELLEGLKEKQPDVLLLDYGLPEMDGLEVRRQMLAEPNLKAIHVIFFFNHASEQDAAEAEKLGEVRYLVKPVNKYEVLSRVDRLIEGSPHERDSRICAVLL